MKVYMEVYGCSANVADFEIMVGLLRKSGFQLVRNPKDSDINIAVTCVVKSPTEQRMIHKIKKLQRFSKPLIVAGCMPKAERELVESIAPQASLLGPNSIQKIVDVAKTTLKNERTVFLRDLREPKICLPRIRKNPMVSIVPIAEGCAWRKCTYCIVKFARGKLLSYPIDLITKEIKQSLREGCREIWITGQDTSAYGLDRGTDLAELLREICKIKGKFFLRVGMMNPIYVPKILNKLIKIYKNEKIFNFLHLPVQSGDNDVLKRMNRSYSVEDFKRIVLSFRKKIPEITIATDIICGFPGESEEAFERSMKLIEEIKPDVLNISRFFPRPKTLAKSMKQLPVRKVKERSKEMTVLSKRLYIERNRAWLGWKGEIFIDEKGKNNSWIGRNFAYKPVVVKSDSFLLGKFMDVRVRKVFPTYLEAEKE
jgi:MiaB-like tRNA modifying enzyme